MKYRKNLIKALIAGMLAASAMVGAAFAADKSEKSDKSDKPATSAQDSSSTEPTLEGSVVNVDQIKEKYWARGDESEMGVVQNRAYSKKGRFEFGLIGGTITSDPFLNTVSSGLSLGYHFSEYVSATVLGLKEFSSNSPAVAQFQSYGGSVNTNPAYSYFGGEAAGSVLYGKLSVLGKSIIYYDLHLLGGLGATTTYSGTYVTPHLGIGQRFFLSKHLSLRLDYRAMMYNETLLNTIVAPGAPTYNSVIGTRANWTHSITLDVNYFFEVFKK